MGTVERGESNLSFSNILKVASTLGISLSALFDEVDQNVAPGGRGDAMKEDGTVPTAVKRSTQKKTRESLNR